MLKSDRFKFIRLDLSASSVDYLVRLVRKSDVIVHEATQPGVRDSWSVNLKFMLDRTL